MNLKFILIALSFCLVLIPGIEMGGKRVFPSELILFGLFASALWKEKKVPILLVFLWTALACSFTSGAFRGNLANTFNFYTIHHTDFFDWKQEFIRFVRWLLLFSTPWFISIHFQSSKGEPTLTFLKGSAVFACVSSLLMLAHQAQWVDLVAWGYTPTNKEWMDRSLGTFPSPQEAGLFLGMMILVVTLNPFGWPLILRAVTVILLAAGTYLTHNGTAALSLLATLLAIPFFSSKKKIWYWIGALVLGIAIFYLVPDQMLEHKWGNFAYRFKIWFRWFEVIQEEPRVLFFGLGFANAVTDNSFFFLLIKLGLVGSLAFGSWFLPLLKQIPSLYRPVFFYWLFSWLALDSIGYWSTGRFAWVLLGLCILNFKSFSRNHLPS